MSEGSGVDVATLAEPIDASWAPPDRRRLLQLALAAVWFLDAALQLQPFMFSRSFGLLMLGPNAQGNPGVIAHPITDVSRSIGQHSVGADTVFLVVQFLIAFGIAYRPTVRLALVGSVLWSAVVWWFGEGLGRVLTGTASPVTGAPGAVLLYAVLAIVLWPTDPRRGDGPFTAARPVGTRAAQGVWVAVWTSLAGFALFESSTRHPSSLLSGLAAGEPGWLGTIDRHAADLVAGRGWLFAAILGAVLVGIALGVFLPAAPARGVIALAIVVAVAIWVVGENFGQIFTGAATDPNSGPLLVLLAVAYWPTRRKDPGSPSTVPAA
jgi:hypothetical protein